MTRLLTIDTSGFFTQVAFALDGVLLNQKVVHSKRASQSLLRLVSDILVQSNTSLKQVNAIGVVTGPGSFTGLRVGVGVAQGLSSAQEIPLLGVSTLALHAKAAFRHGAHYEHCVVCLKAREAEIYVGRYENKSGLLKLQGEEFVLTLNREFERNTEKGFPAVNGAGDGWEYREQITNILRLRVEGEIINNDYSNEDIVDLTYQQFGGKEYSVNEVLLPNYVKTQLNY